MKRRSQICWRVTRDTKCYKNKHTCAHTPEGKDTIPLVQKVDMIVISRQVSLSVKGECKVWKSNTSSLTLYIHLSTCVYGNVTWFHSQCPSDPQGKTNHWVQTGMCLCEWIWVCVWLMVLLRFKLFGPYYEWLLDVSSYNGLLCEKGDGEKRLNENEREGRNGKDVYVDLDFVVKHSSIQTQ